MEFKDNKRLQITTLSMDNSWKGWVRTRSVRDKDNRIDLIVTSRKRDVRLDSTKDRQTVLKI